MKTEVLFTATDIDGETVTLFKTDGAITIEIESADGYHGAFLTTEQAVALAAALANANG